MTALDDVSHGGEVFGGVAVEHDVLETLLEFFIVESSPEIGLLLSVVVPLHHIHSGHVGGTLLKDHRLFVEHEPAFHVHTLPHQELFVLLFRVVDVSQELLRVGRNLLHQGRVLPLVGDGSVAFGKGTAPVHEGIVVGHGGQSVRGLVLYLLCLPVGTVLLHLLLKVYTGVGRNTRVSIAAGAVAG